MAGKNHSKKSVSNAAGAIAGYLRVSMITFPPECRTVEERAAFVDTLRQTRKIELQKAAAQNGEMITEWYDDLGISGRGEFYPKRLAFSRARRDAKEGRLCSFYARDLSRLFRNVVQQELWFAEMEELGVVVHAQDLPFATDAATRRLLRQQMGIIHEYVSSRMGTLIRDRTCTRLVSGLGVAHARSMWGLRYNSDRKAYDLDPETADKVQLVFETYVACGGVGGRAAQHLNLMLAQGHVRATPTPHGKLWNSQLVLKIVRCLRYRRIIQYGDLRISAPDRIPAVVDLALVARADALIEPRQEFFTKVRAKHAPQQKRFTYVDVLRCGYCGGPMRPRPRPEKGNRDVIAWVSYMCSAANHNKGCSIKYSVQQERLHRLVDRGLRRAFGTERSAACILETALGDTIPASGDVEAYVSALNQAATHALEEVLRRLDQKRDRYLELYASGLIKTPEELARHLEWIAQERHALQSPHVPSRNISSLVTAQASPSEVAELRATFLAVWPSDWAIVCDAQKQSLLKSLHATISVRILSHPTKTPGTTDRRRFNAGRLTLTLELPSLGFTGLRALTLAETEEDLDQYWHWRCSFLRPPHQPK